MMGTNKESWVKQNNMKMTMQTERLIYDPATDGMIEVPNTDGSNTQGNCDRCGTKILRFRGQGDLQCSNERCRANYSCCGQRLRDDLHTRRNRSEDDEDIDDMTGNEESWLAIEARENYSESRFDR